MRPALSILYATCVIEDKGHSSATGKEQGDDEEHRAAVSVTRARKPLAFGLVLAAALVAVMLVLVAWTRSAEAAFPGSNGKIAFWTAASILGSADPSATDNEIFSMNANGTDLQQVTVNDKQDFNPAWSPEGTQVAFHSDRDGNGEIYVMNANGTGQTRSIVSAAHENNPDWQPGPRYRFWAGRPRATTKRDRDVKAPVPSRVHPSDAG
jgi:dipeptidyl aminopeptidase/acylaminoacyl peptidase